MKFAPLFGILILLTTATANVNGQTTPQSRPPISSAEKPLRDFLAREWKYWMTQNPESATEFGYPGQNDRWTDYSAPAIERRNGHLVASLRQLRSIPRSALPPDEQLNYDLYQELLETAIEGLNFHFDAMPIPQVTPRNLYMPLSQIEGVLQDIPAIIAAMPAHNVRDYDDILARLNGVPNLIDQTIALMNDGIARGWSPPKITMRDVPKQAESQIVSEPLKSPLLKAFTEYPPDITADQRKGLTSQAVAAYMDEVSPAFQRLRDYLVKTYTPKCRETIAANDLPDGNSFYTYLVKWHTTTNLTSQEIHQTGLDQVKELRGEIDKVIAKSGFHGDLSAFSRFVTTDPQFKYSSADDLLIHVRDIAKRADPQLTHLFGTLPRLPYGVKPIPEAVAPSSQEAYYEDGALAAGRPGYVYVNTYDIESRLKWDTEDLFLHEGVPGHHLQLSLAAELEHVPSFRMHLGYTAFVEGWGLYAESLGPEMGFYEDPYSEFGYLSAQMWRAVRLVVDTGIHSMGWSRDQALEYFRENTGQPEQNVVSETDRYIVWPGQALGYKIGQLEISKLRQKAQQELGERFDIRSFHDMVLGGGALPLTVLDQRAAKWIDAQKKAKTLVH